MAADTAARPTFTFHHAELGEMTGIIAPDKVVQFKAVQYATIPARFKQSVLLGAPLEGNGDHTQPGFASPQGFNYDQASAGGHIPGTVWPPPSDEFKCLILQLNIPLAQLRSASNAAKLPVMIYIHGGGFVLGHIDEQHNTALMVGQSVLDNKPVISASIQYRLGPLGYLHVPEAGSANLALNDQRNALRWIQKFIGGFGGDSKRVTVFGESAGSMSICSHMLSSPPAEGPLFNRAILMSGMLGPSTAPTSIEQAQKTYVDFLKRFGIEEQGEAGLSKLRDVELKRLIEVAVKLNDEGGMWLTVKDEQWYGKDAEAVTWDRGPELLAQCDWVDEIVLGTTGFEGTMVMSRVASITPKAFLDGVTQQLGDESSAIVARAYDITPDMDQNLFMTRCMQWMGDVVFEAPNHALAKYLTTHTNKKVYRYMFDVRNPFPNSSFYNLPHHWVDVYFVFKTLQFRYPTQRLKDISTRHAQLWNGFAHGTAPWTEYKYSGDKQEVIMVADDREGWVERTVVEHERLLEWGWERSDALWKSWESQKGKEFRPLDIEPMKGKPKT